MKLFVAGLSYKTAPVEFREQLAVHATRLRCHGCRLKIAGRLSELVLLSTCNRVEIYGVAGTASSSPERLFAHLAPAGLDLEPYIYVKQDAEAVRHLFSVASGLDSMVIGETEITGQVKQAYSAACEAQLTGAVLNRLFQTALQTAKAVRTDTGIGRGSISVGSVAVELAERIFDGTLSDKSVMIIGAGKMGEACLRHLSKKGAQSVLVANRSFDRAEALAAELGGIAVRFDTLFNAMQQADIVVSSTGCPHTILHRSDLETVMRSRKNRPLVLIDIAVPRDIASDVQSVPGVYLYDVDDLEAIVRENLRQREQELESCRGIIDARVGEVLQRLAKSIRNAASQPAVATGQDLRLWPAISATANA